jgi:hypothetical protein
LINDTAALIVLGTLALAFIYWRLRPWFRDFWKHPLRTLASFTLIAAAGFLFVAFYGGRHRHDHPLFPNSPFRYFAWAICLILFIAAVWIESLPSFKVRRRLKKMRALKRVGIGPRI